MPIHARMKKMRRHTRRIEKNRMNLTNTVIKDTHTNVEKYGTGEENWVTNLTYIIINSWIKKIKVKVKDV